MTPQEAAEETMEIYAGYVPNTYSIHTAIN